MRKTPVKHVVDSYKKDDGTKVRKHTKGSGVKKTTPQMPSSLKKNTKIPITMDYLIKYHVWQKIAKVTGSNGYGEEFGRGWNSIDPDEPEYEDQKEFIDLEFNREDLRIGGYNDIDSNDRRVMEEINLKVNDVMKTYYPELSYKTFSHEKGYWSLKIAK